MNKTDNYDGLPSYLLGPMPSAVPIQAKDRGRLWEEVEYLTVAGNRVPKLVRVSKNTTLKEIAERKLH